MRVLQVHARYRIRGGEDETVDLDAQMLPQAGIAVDQLLADNATLEPGLGIGISAVWSKRGYDRVAEAIARSRPDVLHVHNTWPAWSPAVYDAARAAGVPVVQTLHNYRLMCLNGLLLRQGKPCLECLHRRVKWPGVVHACYRDSRLASSAAALSTAVHWGLGTWTSKVDQFIALGAFAAGLFVEAGVPGEKLAVCPPLIPDPPPVAGRTRSGALFVGRLSVEKGARTLIDAWTGVDHVLTVVGDGPLEAELRARAPANVRFLGRKDRAAVSALMNEAALLLFPSHCYENFSLVPLEAMAHGLPVLASSGGSLAADAGGAVAFAPPDDVGGWRAAAAAWLSAPDRLSTLGAAGRARYLQSFRPDRILARRAALYREVLDRHA